MKKFKFFNLLLDWPISAGFPNIYGRKLCSKTHFKYEVVKLNFLYVK